MIFGFVHLRLTRLFEKLKLIPEIFEDFLNLGKKDLVNRIK